MKLRQKIIIFALAPLILALCIIAFTVHHHAAELSKVQQEVIQPVYLASKENELRGYMMLAKQAIVHLYESGRTDEATLAKAKAILAKLNYGNDGYFFVYDLHGNLLMHPHKPELVGQNRWNYRDINGYPHVRDLIRRANEGGGFVRYAIEKPSLKKPALKLTYALPLSNWGWVLCSGIYLDDVDDALARVDTQVLSNNLDTMQWIGGIAFLGMVVIIFTGLMLNIRERIDAKEEERVRVARELHDSVCQRLVSVKLQIETGIIRLEGIPEQSVTQDMLEDMAEKLNEAVAEVRDIAHGLYPETIGLGLASALRQLAHDMTSAVTSISFIAAGETSGLSDFSNVTLYRIAQEALNNSKRHAVAHRISMQLEGDYRYVTLTICDDGVGFDVDNCNIDKGCGMGLRNMRQRLEDEKVDGKLTITSSAHGTTIVAKVPRIPRNTFLINLWPPNRK